MDLFTVSELLDELATQELVMGLFLCGAGLVFMLMGTRIARALVAISFGVVGFVIGGMMPVAPTMQLVMGLLGAALLGAASTFVLRASVAVLAGGWAGLAMIGICDSLGVSEQITLIFALLALVAAVSLTFIMYDEVLAFVTSLEGAIMFLSGMVVFLSQNQTVWYHIRSLVRETPVFLPFLILAGTVTGFYLQQAELRRKDMGGA